MAIVSVVVPRTAGAVFAEIQEADELIVSLTKKVEGRSISYLVKAEDGATGFLNTFAFQFEAIKDLEATLDGVLENGDQMMVKVYKPGKCTLLKAAAPEDK